MKTWCEVNLLDDVGDELHGRPVLLHPVVAQRDVVRCAGDGNSVNEVVVSPSPSPSLSPSPSPLLPTSPYLQRGTHTTLGVLTLQSKTTGCKPH